MQSVYVVHDHRGIPCVAEGGMGSTPGGAIQKFVNYWNVQKISWHEWESKGYSVKLMVLDYPIK